MEQLVETNNMNKKTQLLIAICVVIMTGCTESCDVNFNLTESTGSALEPNGPIGPMLTTDKKVI